MNYHKGCGGKITNRVCSKCNKKWGMVRYFTAKDIDFKNENLFNPQEYKKRIRQGKDIP